MKIVVATQQGDTAPLVQRLQEEGHAVSLYVAEPKYNGVVQGLVPRVSGIGGIEKLQPDLVVLLENSSKDLAERLSDMGLLVLGGTELARRLETDRSFSLKLVSECGIKIPQTYPFTEGPAAIEFLKDAEQRLCVKVDEDGGDKYMSFLGQSNDDVIHFIETKYKVEKHKGLVLQEYVEGPAELNTEAWFSGGDLIWPVNAGMEQKRLMSGDLGPNTGCMSTLTWPLSKLPKVWTTPLLTWLKKSEYTGPLDMAFKVGQDYELYFLEFTPRLGINAGFGLFDLMDGDLGEWLEKVALGDSRTMPLRNEYDALITLSTYPYPYEIPSIYLPGCEVSFEDVDWTNGNFWPAFVALEGNKYVTSEGYPLIGYTSVRHQSAWMAIELTLQMANKIKVSGKQYRNDMSSMMESLMIANYLGMKIKD